MFIRSILFAGAAAVSLIGAAVVPASAAPYYRCGDSWCYDDQAEATRQLNLMQLDNPGAGRYAVPGYRGDDNDRYGDDDHYGDDDRYGDDRDEDRAPMRHRHHDMQGGYGYSDQGDEGPGAGGGRYGHRHDDGDGYGRRNDDGGDYGRPDSDDDQYGDDDDQDDNGAYDDNDDDRR